MKDQRVIAWIKDERVIAWIKDESVIARMKDGGVMARMKDGGVMLRMKGESSPKLFRRNTHTLSFKETDGARRGITRGGG